MYKSPIELIYKDAQYQLEDGIYKAIQQVDIKVDREELIKALKYDRDQYKKGYEDAKAERKKGKWITKSTFMPDHYGGYYIDQYVCTNCESEFFKPSKFCPNCGADLRGKDEGNN